ncbi:hypothetical protein BDW75DRAFT_242275 [Aspergillus navahoensis]
MKTTRISLPAVLFAVGLPFRNHTLIAIGSSTVLLLTSPKNPSPKLPGKCISIRQHLNREKTGRFKQFFTGCTTIIGDIHISNQYTDPSFVLNDILNVSGRIFINDNDDDDQASGILSSFVMLDMVSLTELHLRDVPNVQVPSVQTVEDARSIRVEGPWASVNMQSLKDVTSKLIICSETGCEVDYFQEPEETPVVAANFSALESATYIGVNGSFANISMLNLHAVGLSDLPASSGFEFHYRGLPAADFTLSPLHTLYGRLIIMGDVDGLSISPITNTSASIYINTTTRSEIFSTLREAASLDIHGKIAEFRIFPFLTTGDNLNITSEYEDTISCPPSLQDLYNSTAASPSDIPSWCLEDSDKNDDDDDDHDEGFKAMVGSESSSMTGSFPPGAIVAIVVVVILVASFCIRAMRRGGEKGRSTGDGVRSQNANDNADRIENGNGNGIENTVPTDDERGGVPPPPYSKDPPVL